jgi:hypothetical protein
MAAALDLTITFTGHGLLLDFRMLFNQRSLAVETVIFAGCIVAGLSHPVNTPRP